MIVKSIQTGVLSCGALIAGLGLVHAQPADADGTAADSSAVDSPADSSSGDPERSAESRSPETMFQEAQTTLDRMEAAADNIARMLRAAREDKDVVKILCLDDKLNQMNVAARSAEDRVASIEAAVKSGNNERAQHDDAVLGALASRANDLAVEANQCIGAEQGVLGATELQIRIDPAIPKADTAAPAPTVIISAPPVAASPTL